MPMTTELRQRLATIAKAKRGVLLKDLTAEFLHFASDEAKAQGFGETPFSQAKHGTSPFQAAYLRYATPEQVEALRAVLAHTEGEVVIPHPRRGQPDRRTVFLFERAALMVILTTCGITCEKATTYLATLTYH